MAAVGPHVRPCARSAWSVVTVGGTLELDNLVIEKFGTDGDLGEDGIDGSDGANGANGGPGGPGGAGGPGDPGGAGGVAAAPVAAGFGGPVRGSAILIDTGGLVRLTRVVLRLNAVGGDGGDGGDGGLFCGNGGNAGGGGNGGAGGMAGDGGDALGGAIFNAGQLSPDATVAFANNQVIGGLNGDADCLLGAGPCPGFGTEGCTAGTEDAGGEPGVAGTSGADGLPGAPPTTSGADVGPSN